VSDSSDLAPLKNLNTAFVEAFLVIGISTLHYFQESTKPALFL
jgi:hypothetical protein